MSEPIRILQIVNIMDRAGLETMIMNHYREIDRSQVQFDFLVHRPQRGEYEDEIESLGGRVFRAPRLYPQHCLSYRRFMRRFFAEHRYPVVHSHIDAMSAFPLAMARGCGVPVRIAHSHNDAADRDLKYPIKEAARRKLPAIATHYWACSEAAGTFLFGEANLPKVHVVKNAIDLEGYRFDAGTRARMRAELGLAEDQVVVGHVGRFSAVKNHAFLVDILAEMRREGTNAALVLTGDGELRHEVERKAFSLGLDASVRFLGLRGDVPDVVQAFDVLVFPSLHEGIPLSLIEAQASGLPALASDAVSAEAMVLPNAERLPLSAPVSEWARAAVMLAEGGRTEDPIPLLAEAGYEIGASALSLMAEYQRLYRGADAS